MCTQTQHDTGPAPCLAYDSVEMLLKIQGMMCATRAGLPGLDKLSRGAIEFAFMFEQDILREWKAAHAAITESLLEEETISGAKIEELMDANPAEPQLMDISDWQVER